MGKPAARLTDLHTCPMVTGIVPHVGGPIILGSPTVLSGKLPQARVTDPLTCVGPLDTIVMGSCGVFVNKLPAARMGDVTAHGGVITVGLPTVLIGETAMGAPVVVTPGSVSVAFGHAEAQAAALRAAAASGRPFCEPCFAAARSAAR